MSIPLDPSPRLQQYAHPESLVTGSWLGSVLGLPSLKVLEASSDPQAYNIGHIPYAQRLDWHRDLINPVQRNILNPEKFQELMRSKGISPDDTIILYGNQANKWATYAYWIFRHYGHVDVRLLNGGRDAWMREEKESTWSIPEVTRSEYPLMTPDPSRFRIFQREVLDTYSDSTVIDVRKKEEFTGEHAGSLARRSGHIPGAQNISWEQTLHPNGRFKNIDELREIFGDSEKNYIVYSNTGKRSAHTWFVLNELLGLDNVNHYDGSWVEWGNMMNMPITNELATLEQRLEAVNEEGDLLLDARPTEPQLPRKA